MSYESAAYDKVNDDGFGPDPVVVAAPRAHRPEGRRMSDGLIASCRCGYMESDLGVHRDHAWWCPEPTDREVRSDPEGKPGTTAPPTPTT